MSKSVRVAVTGAAGQIGYALLFRIGSGQMFGPDTKVHLSMLELEAALPAAGGVEMELDDCAFPNLAGITVTADADVAFKDADWALLIGAVPRKKGMERADLLKINANVFTAQGASIGKVARPDCKTVVVGNPCNTNALIAMSAGKLKRENVFAMTALDQNRAVTQLAKKAGVPVTEVENVIIWGNHSPTMYPDFPNATIGGKPLPDVITDSAWLEGDFLKTVQQRGAAIINARGASSAASAANAVVDTVRWLLHPSDKACSIAVPSDGSYGVPEGLVFSYPIRSHGACKYEIIQGVGHGDFGKAKLQTTIDELASEREAVKDLL